MHGEPADLIDLNLRNPLGNVPGTIGGLTKDFKDLCPPNWCRPRNTTGHIPHLTIVVIANPNTNDRVPGPAQSPVIFLIVGGSGLHRYRPASKIQIRVRGKGEQAGSI